MDWSVQYFDHKELKQKYWSNANTQDNFSYHNIHSENGLEWVHSSYQMQLGLYTAGVPRASVLAKAWYHGAAPRIPRAQ